MAYHFLDSSALLKRYRDEVGTSMSLNFFAKFAALFVARLAHVEVTSAIVRRGREPGNTPELIATALAALDREMREIYEVVEIEGGVIPRAIDLARTRHLRAADAIQLACALLACIARLHCSPGLIHRNRQITFWCRRMRN
jgi:predicted nucleic acid-binding protein